MQNPARGIAKITKHGSVQCIAGHNMVFLSKDYNMDSYIFGCPVLNEEARRKLEHMGVEVPKQCECEKKEECCPNSEIGRIYRVKREVLSQIDWDNPQFSYRFKLVYSLRTKIERLFSRMKERFKMAHIYKRGISKIRGHILKFMNLMLGAERRGFIRYPRKPNGDLRSLGFETKKREKVVTKSQPVIQKSGKRVEGGVYPNREKIKENSIFLLNRRRKCVKMCVDCATTEVVGNSIFAVRLL